MAEKLSEELMAAYRKEGAAISKRENVHRMAEANKAFRSLRLVIQRTRYRHKRVCFIEPRFFRGSFRIQGGRGGELHLFASSSNSRTQCSRAE